MRQKGTAMDSDLKKRIEALRTEAEEQARKGQIDRAAQIRQGELSKLEAANGSQSHGGTQAKGFADSLTQQGQSS